MGNWHFGPQSDQSHWAIQWGQKLWEVILVFPEGQDHSWHGHRGTLHLRGELRTSGLKLAGCSGLQPWVQWRWGREGSPQTYTPEEEIPWESHGEEKGKISAVLQPWLLKRDYMIACWSRKWPHFEVRRVRESGPGWAEPEPQLPGQIGIPRYQM